MPYYEEATRITLVASTNSAIQVAGGEFGKYQSIRIETDADILYTFGEETDVCGTNSFTLSENVGSPTELIIPKDQFTGAGYLIVKPVSAPSSDYVRITYH